MGEWISVEDRLPDDQVGVIVEGGLGYIRQGEWWSITGERYPGRPILWTVTHWMPFPKAPDAQEQHIEEQDKELSRVTDRMIEKDGEIARLRANIDAMNANRDHVYPLTLADHTRTIAKLRGALERIATRDYNETAQEFAKAALEENK